MTDATEVAVVGAGPAGAATALRLARLGRCVALVHAGRGRAAVGEALPGGARPLLHTLGLLDVAEGHEPCAGTLSAWGAAEPSRRDALRDPHGAGRHLDRARFDAEVRGAAASAGADLWTTDRPARVERAGDGWRIETPHRVLDAEYVIDATGRASAVARTAGAKRLRDDRLVAFVARYPPDASGSTPDPWTRLDAVSDGWWYTVGTAVSRIVAFHTDADLADRSALLAPEGFVRRAAEAPWLGDRLATLSPARVRGVDAGSARLDRPVGDGWLAVGDAAVSFDPLSSQGLLNALYTGLRGAEAAHAHLSGNPAATTAYADRLAAIYATYRGHHAVVYGAERRWPSSPFWARRTAATHAHPETPLTMPTSI